MCHSNSKGQIEMITILLKVNFGRFFLMSHSPSTIFDGM